MKCTRLPVRSVIIAGPDDTSIALGHLRGPRSTVRMVLLRTSTIIGYYRHFLTIIATPTVLWRPLIIAGPHDVDSSRPLATEGLRVSKLPGLQSHGLSYGHGVRPLRWSRPLRCSGPLRWGRLKRPHELGVDLLGGGPLLGVIA
jgi:hypothetical protein